MRPIYASQIFELTIASMKTRYRSAWAGFFWVVFNPLLIFAVQCYAFKLVLKLNVDKYVLFLASGLLPWVFVVQSIEMCAALFVRHGRLLKSFPVDPLVLLLAQILDNAFNFIVAMTVVLVPLAFHYGSSYSFLLLPICVALLFFSVTSLCWLLAVANIFFQDMRYIAAFVVSVAFFLTPVFYPEGFIPESFRWVLMVNPFYYMIEPFHVAIYKFDAIEFVHSCIYSFSMGTIFFLIGGWVWKAKRNAIYNRF